MTAQRDRALAEANRVRVENARTLKDLAHMPPAVAPFAAAALLRRPMRREGAINVLRLLASVPRIGRPTAGRMLAAVGVTITMRVRDLTPSQRDALAVMLTVVDDDRPRARREPDSPARRANRRLRAAETSRREAARIAAGEAALAARRDAIARLRRARPDIIAPEQVVQLVAQALTERTAA